MDSLITDITQLNLAGELQNRDLALYSTFILIFITLIMGIVFLLSMNVITRPLVRLQAAVQELSAGNFSIQVQESRRSPINPLIRTFNEMVTELEENRRKLLQAEKDLVWREMAKIMAHEIKNPLTPIRLATQRMEHNYISQSPNFEKIFQESARIIQEEVESLQRLVQAFSEFAKMPALQPEVYDLNEQFRELGDHFQDQAEFDIRSKNDTLKISGDRLQLRQVWVNLIQNAILSSRADKKCAIQIRTKMKNKWVIVEIRDNGPGIPAENLDKIFQPYFTTRERGTGLGLAIVKRIIELHGGDIVVHSDSESGTIFTIRLKALQD